jgi:predicted RNA-binding Zn ribbon-like protein
MVSMPPPFLVAGHPAIDFLNSRATPGGVVIDWLRDGDSAVAWFASLGFFPEAALRDLRENVSTSSLDELATEARALRELLRKELSEPAGLRSSSRLWRVLNEILARGSAFSVLRQGATGPALAAAERLERPGQLLVPVANAIGRLFAEEDLNRVRACDGAGCTLWFLDQTKSGRRRFCSPAVCGNRAKVAAFRARQATADK